MINKEDILDLSISIVEDLTASTAKCSEDKCDIVENTLLNWVKNNQPKQEIIDELLVALTDLFNDVMYLGIADECNGSFQKASKVIDETLDILNK